MDNKVYGFEIPLKDKRLDLSDQNEVQRFTDMFGALLNLCGLHGKFYLHVNGDQLGVEVEPHPVAEVSRVEKHKGLYQESYESVF